VDVVLYQRGIVMFNRGEFYDAHEVLEDVWRASVDPEKKFLQALIQTAVALHHHSTGNVVGCQSLMARALRNFSGYPDGYCGVELEPLRVAMGEWVRVLSEGGELPPLPKVNGSWSETKPR
jgi:predicted metal-dependent hydrolase